MNRFARFAWGVLLYELAVVAWGAYVRATGSGGGCGRHWPLCDGMIVPRAPGIAMLIELSHRVSSAGALVLSIVLVAWAFRAHPPRHPARRAAVATLALMVSEALIGAVLVLFELVALDASLRRAVSVSLHLVNTFLLLASTALTAWWSSGGARIRLRGQGGVAWMFALSLGALLFVGAGGAVNALGDTLFPSASLSAGLTEDFAPGAQLFVRLRVFHPLLAAATAAIIVVTLGLARSVRPTRAVRVLAGATTALVVSQAAVGILNVIALAPIGLQLAHLVVADALWIVLVLAAAAALAPAPSVTPLPIDPADPSQGPTDGVPST
jgi:heme A synthase